MSYQYQYTPPKDNMKDNENQRFNQENNRASVDGGSMQSGNVGANTFDNTTPTLPPKPLGMEYSSQQEQQQHQQRMERYGNIKKQYEEPSAPPLPPKPKEMGSLEWSFDESDGNNGSLGMHIEAGLIAGTSAGGATGEHTLLTQVKELESMGFPEEKAILALEMYDYDIEKATNYLLDHYML
ncbi:hypothetical protein AX774_g6026 [Zancudomyces culisetae]|uniref:UBA domain-containing protein n=1 Tax=Zancudomyces culisetae TaxID=1213189 RepID=A0A1R1PI59_ZANCU|nr:hypothetical protein AX774_g6026 [Zancudomyces culisetae]|eukprot:OMH80532.1 hypothetical protein AX774_g6026 [Zancudomyces culisetae]